MRPGPGEINSLIVFFVDQKPVGRDMTFPVSHKSSFQFVIAMLWVKGLFIDEIIDYGLDFRHVEAPFFSFFKLAFK